MFFSLFREINDFFFHLEWVIKNMYIQQIY